MSSIVAAAVTPLLLLRGVAMAPHLAGVWVAGLIATAAAVVLLPNLRSSDEESGDLPRARGRGGWKLGVIIVVSAAALMPLGAVYAWGGLTLVGLGASAVTAAIAAFAFTAAQGAVQLAGAFARVSRPRRVVLIGAATALLGATLIGVAAFAPHLPMVARIAMGLIAFAFVGAGLALAPPVLQGVTGQIAEQLGRKPGVAIATLTVANYMALGVGQVVQGGISTAVGVPTAAALLFVLSGLVMLIGASIVPRR